MLILRPKRGIEKPIGAISMNWGHPLSTGLISCLPFNEQGPNWNNRASLPLFFDAAGGRFPGKWVDSSDNWFWNVDGPGVRLSTTLNWVSIGNLASALPTDGVTILMIRRKTDTTLRSCVHLSNTESTAAKMVWAYCPYSDGNVYWDFGGNTGTNRLTVTGLSWDTKVDRLAFTAGGNGMSFWRNGKKLGSQSTAVTRTASAAATEYRINTAPAGIGDLVDVFFFAVSSVQWDDSLVSWWMEEPYGMLMPQSPVHRMALLGRQNTTPPIWGGWSFPSGTQFIPYDYTWDMPTSAQVVSYSVIAGALPDGLSLTALTGNQAHIHGIPTVIGLFNFTLRATNSYGTSDKDFSIIIAGIPSGVAGGSFTFIG